MVTKVSFEQKNKLRDTAIQASGMSDESVRAVRELINSEAYSQLKDVAVLANNRYVAKDAVEALLSAKEYAQAKEAALLSKHDVVTKEVTFFLSGSSYPATQAGYSIDAEIIGKDTGYDVLRDIACYSKSNAGVDVVRLFKATGNDDAIRFLATHAVNPETRESANQTAKTAVDTIRLAAGPQITQSPAITEEISKEEKDKLTWAILFSKTTEEGIEAVHKLEKLGEFEIIANQVLDARALPEIRLEMVAALARGEYYDKLFTFGQVTEDGPIKEAIWGILTREGISDRQEYVAINSENLNEGMNALEVLRKIKNYSGLVMVANSGENTEVALAAVNIIQDAAKENKIDTIRAIECFSSIAQSGIPEVRDVAASELRVRLNDIDTALIAVESLKNGGDPNIFIAIEANATSPKVKEAAIEAQKEVKAELERLLSPV